MFTLAGVFSLYSASSPSVKQEVVPASKDSISQKKDTTLRYPVRRTVPETTEENAALSPADLKNPQNLGTVIEYDTKTGTYQMKTKLGEEEIGTPINLTAEEYLEYQQKESSAAYWREKNKIDFSKKKDDFSLTDMQFDIGMGDKIFGEGGVKLKTKGSIETKFGIKNNKVDNPAFSENAKDKTYFDFDQKVQMSVNGKVGDKINVNMNYDTEATFDYDAKSVKLRYEGKEDEIIKSIEGGNVSMPVNSSLISGGSSLFGVKTALQFGKLSATAVVSQQQSQIKSVSLSGGVQTNKFDLDVAAYDENRHYFLSQYFKNNYDSWMSNLPYISSGITITKVEVWVTNKTGNLDNARNIVAFADLGEPTTIYKKHWVNNTGAKIPANSSNSLYSEITQQYVNARNFSDANATLAPLNGGEINVNVGEDYERLESARRLESSEYTLNSTLGYISLRQSLNSDEILAVAYEYTKNGQTYQVGEFSTDGIESPKTLFVKMLKGTDYSPTSPTWELMMKNIYSIGAYNVESKNFELNITYKSDSVGTDINYLTEGKIKNTLLLRVMNLDHLNSKQEAYPDGVFDYVEGYTVQSTNGRIIFPVREPFGKHLREAIGDSTIADKYVFEELYDSTLTVAQQLTEKNKFRISGSYKASSGATISLGAMNVASGSVVVTAGGQTLTENTDYTVDYASGTVTILNEALITSGTAINATCEDQSTFSMMRKSMAGITLDYKFSDNFNVGGTLMHLSETPLTTKVDMGSESVSNTIWGINTSFKTESQFLTNLIDKLPLINATKPSQFSMNGEFAQLIAGSSKTLDSKSYIDDFEASEKPISLKDQSQWYLASTPYDPAGGLFPEAALSDNVRYGYNRSLLAWYTIDGIFNQNNSSQTPSHIRNDLEQLSNHYVRAIREREIFPDRNLAYNQTGLLSVMNLAYYPKERGPYNFDWESMNTDGTLKNPKNRWGGIMRKIESGYTNFESNNVEYIEFWMMDPFVYDSLDVSTGGDLYFNLGEISEDVLKDGKRSFENGLPTSAGDTSLISTTKWGKVSAKTSTAYAFDNTAGVRSLQDVGLDGLSTEEEKNWKADYIAGVRTKVVDPVAIDQMEKDPFSPINDPAGDNYHYFRGTDYDNQKTSILNRYKHYNGYEGNSQSTENSGESYSTAATTLPNVEDINLDFTLNETERYYQYRVSIRHADMEVGKNFIKDKRTSSVTLKNGKVEQVSWYQFKIPIDEYKEKVGAISGFNSIRFIRMYLTGFEDSTILRLASLDLVRGDWRNYTKDLYTTVPVSDAVIDVSTVGLEENSSRTPINYKLPPGVSRETDPSQPGVYLQDEKSLALKISDLSPGDARSVYKNTSYDFRQYDRLQMFVHSEAFEKDVNPPKNYEMTVFMRLGADYQNNYYEYEIPLEISEPYVNVASAIWPDNNFFDIPFDLLTKVKNNRNAAGYPVSYTKEYSEFDPDHEQNKVKIVGNPSLADVKTIMIGIRNNGTMVKSVEIWVNELRLSGFNEEGGYAALGSAVLGLSDLGTITASGRYESDGFGGLEQSVSERRMDSYGQYNMAFNFNLGRFLPEKAKVNIPLFYSISKETTTPKYDPLNEDLLLSDVLDATKSKAARDSILNYSQTLKTYKSLSLTNVKVDLKSKIPLPIDPANLTFNYSQNEAFERDATTEYQITKNYTGGINYSYSSPLKPWQPFAKSKKMVSPWYKSLKDLNLNFLPNNITANSNLIRYYYEMQSRDLTSTSSDEVFPLTVSKNFLWNTDLSVNWNITTNLKLYFSMNNRAEVEETLTAPVNKELFATEYQNWKDTVSRSLREFGTPLDYTQTANLTWQVPLNRIPVLDFINMNTQYNAVYDWTRSSTADAETDLGNQVSNQRVMSLTSVGNLVNLYNKWDFLKKINKKNSEVRRQTAVAKKTPSNSKQKKVTEETPKKPVVKELKKYEKETVLFKDSVMNIKHNLKNKRVFMVAIDSTGKRVPLRFKVKDENNLLVYPQENRTLKLSVIQKPALDDEGWYQVAQVAARTMMSVRNISVTYKQTDGMIIPGFKPESGLISKSEYGTAPGWDFALGFQPDDYLQRAKDKDWLIVSDSITSPAIMTKVTDLRIKSTIEPLKGLKIDLNAARSWSNNTQIQYMFDGMPETKTGSFTMTTVAFSTAFKSSKASDGYASEVFQKFIDNRKIIAARLENKMSRKDYPNAGFLSGTSYANHIYDPANGTFDLNSADVLIPAFLAAYTGKDANKSNLDIFPSLKALLPNWTISYDGLSNIDFIRKYFTNITINHAYTCTYNVSSFSSFNTFVDAGDGLGFVRDVLTKNPVPSSMYDISSITLTEAFNPLFRIQGTLLNGWTFNSEIRKNRTMNLSISGGQVVEADQYQYAVGTNYKISNFHPWGFMEKSKVKNDLSLSGKLSYKNQHSLLRKIEENYTQASSGNKTFVIELMGDYVISKNMNLTMFYDYESTIPLVSSYPVTSSDFGFSIRFILDR
ncbi:MAG: cell surface protein SprA [Bacteroidales bacterium]|nr:cell surface protein SprA [Bacteroidales bacterium]